MELLIPTRCSGPSYLDRLNEAQRSAVLHGDGQVADPLLVIAGAGTGKTSTLASRVAHAIAMGADPRRMLMMTFSRRAALEMTRRIERILREVLGEKAAAMIAGLTWAGTFHAIGARILREHAPALGLDPAFTVHDRSDSADLMNHVRHALGFSQTESRFPGKKTCLDIYSRAVNGREPLEPLLKSDFPWCLGWAAELKALFAGYVEAEQVAQVLDYDELLLFWAEMVSDPAAAAALGCGDLGSQR
jgi:DNA helicase-2/ATP-dependent DNA helicase PcrA